MSDREARDLARREKKGTPTPKKSVRITNKSSENKENEIKPCRKGLNFSDGSSDDATENVATATETDTDIDLSRIIKNKDAFDHPVYKEISMKNGLINRSDLSMMKRMCREEGLETAGKRDMVKQRLKQFFKTKLLVGAGLLPPAPHRGYDYYLVVDFEATCEERNSPDFPHEIIEFPGVLVDGRTGQEVARWREYVRPVLRPDLSDFCTALTGIGQQTVDRADTFPSVLAHFTSWLEERGLGTKHTFALVTDGPFDVGRFLRLACQQAGLAVPGWAAHWVNVRKGFANFYRVASCSNGPLRLPGLSNMLDRLSLEFEGSPHSGLDDSVNIARVVSRMVADGAVLKVNERLELEPEASLGRDGRPRQLPHVLPVSGAAAQAWLQAARNRVANAASK